MIFEKSLKKDKTKKHLSKPKFFKREKKKVYEKKRPLRFIIN
jgi:hypothetical protein